MQAYRIETTVQTDGKIVLENLPFDKGDAVEVIVLETKKISDDLENSLRGKLLKYDDPFEPTAVEDWEVLK